MTALEKFARLETTGLWRETPDAQRREVVVAFRNASVVLSDFRTSAIISHWSLPAIRRRNPGAMPAIYAPSDEADSETLELDDQLMIDAIGTVQRALAKPRFRPGSLRKGVVIATLAAALGAAALWLPAALVNHTAGVIPFVKRQEIGTNLLAAMTRYTSPPCRSEEGERALARLAERLFPQMHSRIVVLRDGLPKDATLGLPGQIMLVHQSLVEGFDAPEVVAGHLLATASLSSADDPVYATLREAGLRATFTLLATGVMPKSAFDSQAREQLLQVQPPLDPEAVLAQFQRAKVSAAPYAATQGTDPDLRRLLQEHDPVPPSEARPLIADADWLAIQTICHR